MPEESSTRSRLTRPTAPSRPSPSATDAKTSPPRIATLSSTRRQASPSSTAPRQSKRKPLQIRDQEEGHPGGGLRSLLRSERLHRNVSALPHGHLAAGSGGKRILRKKHQLA